MDYSSFLDWIDVNKFSGYRFALNLVSVFILVRYIFLKNQKKTELFFTFFTFNLIIFFLSGILKNSGLSAGAGFGLFAIFSLLRYRTEGMTAVDMTYLFLSIAIGLITAIMPGNYLELPLICFTILILTFIFESNLFYKKESSKIIFFDNIGLIKKTDGALLLQDLKERTGLNISRVEIQEIDFLKDSCKLIIFFYEQ